MTAWRARMYSDEEPAALRHVPAGGGGSTGEPLTAGSDWELPTALSPEPLSRASRYNSAALVRDLRGATAEDFSALEFVRTLLGDGASSGSAEGSLDANAALSTLDGTELLLRKRRDVAARDEEASRADLRQALHEALRERDDALRCADGVQAGLTGMTGRAASAAAELRSVAGRLMAASARRDELELARDAVRLLGPDAAEMGVVRASEVLAALRAEVHKGSLDVILCETDAEDALERLTSCEQDLADRLRVGLDDAHSNDVLRELCLAARNLKREPQLVDAYIERLPLFTQRSKALVEAMGAVDADVDVEEIVQPLATARWECTTALRDFIPVAQAAFPDAVTATAQLLRELVVRSLMPVAEALLVSVRACGEGDDHVGNTNGPTYTWTQKQRMLKCYARAIRAVTGAVFELIDQCMAVARDSPRTGASDAAARATFGRQLDGVVRFVAARVSEYARTERECVAESVRAAYDVAARLDDLKAPEPGQYAAFRSSVLRATRPMPKIATTACAHTLEAMERAVSIARCCAQLDGLMTAASHPVDNDDVFEGGTVHTHDDLSGTLDAAAALVPDSARELVRVHLATAESVLHGALQLVPQHEDAGSDELWTKEVSPLGTYLECKHALQASHDKVKAFLTSGAWEDADEPKMAENDALVAARTTVAGDVLYELDDGTRRLGWDAGLGVTAAVDASAVRCGALLRRGRHSYAKEGKNDATAAFVDATRFVKGELLACAGAQEQPTAAALAERVRDTVVAHWARCKGPFTHTGALRVALDARHIAAAFNGAPPPAQQAVGALGAVAQMLFDDVDEVWSTLEAGAIGAVNPRAILDILRKRADMNDRQLDKMRACLAVADDEIEVDDARPLHPVGATVVH